MSDLLVEEEILNYVNSNEMVGSEGHLLHLGAGRFQAAVLIIDNKCSKRHLVHCGNLQLSALITGARGVSLGHDKASLALTVATILHASAEPKFEVEKGWRLPIAIRDCSQEGRRMERR